MATLPRRVVAKQGFLLPSGLPEQNSLVAIVATTNRCMLVLKTSETIRSRGSRGNRSVDIRIMIEY